LPTNSKTTTATSLFAFAVAALLALSAPAEAKTALELSTGVRYLIEESAAFHFTTAEVTFFVNRAQNAVIDLVDDRALNDIAWTGTQAVVVGQYAQAIPAGVARVAGVSLNGYAATRKEIGEIRSIEPLTKREDVKASNPYYCLFAGSILLYPFQTAAGTLEVHAIRYPSALSADADECDLSERVEDLVILQAAVYLLLKDHETMKAQALQERLLQEVALMNAKHGAPANTPGASK
jgi:hypothetical protein